MLRRRREGRQLTAAEGAESTEDGVATRSEHHVTAAVEVGRMHNACTARLSAADLPAVPPLPGTKLAEWYLPVHDDS